MLEHIHVVGVTVGVGVGVGVIILAWHEGQSAYPYRFTVETVSTGDEPTTPISV